jgi:uncharacterized protein (TIGR00369 family)
MSTVGEADLLAFLQRRSSAGIGGHLGHELVEIDAAAGIARAKFKAGRKFLNPLGSVQGGILTAMLDEVMVDAALARLGRDVVIPTLEIKTTYLRAAPAGPLSGEGRVVRAGRSVVFTEGVLFDAGGNEVARASASATIRPLTGGAGKAGPD